MSNDTKACVSTIRNANVKKQQLAGECYTITQQNRLDTDNLWESFVSHFGECVRVIAWAHPGHPIIGRRHSTQNNQNDFYKLKVVNFSAVFLSFILTLMAASEITIFTGRLDAQAFLIENERHRDSIDFREQKRIRTHIRHDDDDARRRRSAARWHRFLVDRRGVMWVHCAMPVNEEQKSPPFIIESNLCENNENRSHSNAYRGQCDKVKPKFIESDTRVCIAKFTLFPYTGVMVIFIFVKIYKTGREHAI